MEGAEAPLVRGPWPGNASCPTQASSRWHSDPGREILTPGRKGVRPEPDRFVREFPGPPASNKPTRMSSDGTGYRAATPGSGSTGDPSNRESSDPDFLQKIPANENDNRRNVVRR